MDKLDKLLKIALEGYVDPEIEKIEKTETRPGSPYMERFRKALKVYVRDKNGVALFPGFPEFCQGDCQCCSRRIPCCQKGETINKLTGEQNGIGSNNESS